jgi:hypothetical protein
MSGTHICWIVAGCLTALVKPSLSQSQSITVSVRVYNHANVRHETLERAQSEATRIFAQAGLELKWLPDPLSENARQEHSTPDTTPRKVVLDIRLLSESMAKRLRRPGNRFGFALNLDAFVFFHRVEELARDGNSSLSTILGHIMAHELGHLVLGESSHSSEGIMTETLQKKHFEQANKGKLLFRAEEAQRMRVRCTMNSALAHHPVESYTQITVRVYNYATVSPDTLTSVKNGASLIFQQAGIDTSWLDCRRALSNSPVPQQCQEPSGPTDVVLRIVLEPKSDGDRMALSGLGFAFAEGM